MQWTLCALAVAMVLVVAFNADDYTLTRAEQKRQRRSMRGETRTEWLWKEIVAGATIACFVGGVFAYCATKRNPTFASDAETPREAEAPLSSAPRG